MEGIIIKKINLQNVISIDEKSINVVSVFKSVFIAYVLCLVLLGVFAIFLTYTNFSESSIPTVVLSITMISIIFASQMSARYAKNRGWLIGGITGLVFIIILYLISLIFTQRAVFDSHLVMMFLLSIIAGSIGGIIGINFKKPEKRHR